MTEEFKSYFSAELVDEILDKCRKLIQKQPNNPVHQRNLGFVLFKKGSYQEALESFQNVLKLSPNDTTVCLALGRCHELVGNLEKALEVFNDARSQKPKWPDTHFWVAKVYFALNELDKAEEVLQQAIEINSAFKDAMYLLALVHEKRGEEKMAIAELKKVIALPNMPQKTRNPFPYEMSVLYDDPILLDEVIRQLESFISASPGYADVHLKLGMAYRRKGLKEKALAEFRRALQLNPNLERARHHYWNWDEDGMNVE